MYATGLWYSVGITLVALALFGYTKGRFTGISPWKGAVQTVLTGGLAAAAAFALAKFVSTVITADLNSSRRRDGSNAPTHAQP